MEHSYAVLSDSPAAHNLAIRLLVRAGLDPSLRARAALDELVVSIMRGTLPEVAGMCLQSRAKVAAAAIRGWVYSRA